MYPEDVIAKVSSFIASMDRVVTAKSVEFVFANDEVLIAVRKVDDGDLAKWLETFMHKGFEIIGILALDKNGEFDFAVVHACSMESGLESTEQEEQDVLSFKENLLRRCEAAGQSTQSVVPEELD